MFFFKKLVTYFILPPGIFILVLAVGGIYLIKRRQKTGYMFLVAGLILYALCVRPVADALIGPLENYYPLKRNLSGDVILVLGSGGNMQAPDLEGKGFPSGESLSRLVCAYRLWKRLQVPIIFSGGEASGVAKKVLVEMGVLEMDVIEENHSRDTYENTDHTRRIIEARGFESPILVTSAYHMRRAVLNFASRDIRVTPFPCDYKATKDYNIYAFLPKQGRLMVSSIALKEYMGLMAYNLGIF